MVILGFILIAAFIVILFKVDDAQNRANGRARRNNLLTKYGFGSFGEGMRASAASLSLGCLSKIIGVIALITVLFCFTYKN